MAISTRSRRGTSPSFWRNHNAMQTMLATACMPSMRPAPRTVSSTLKPIPPMAVQRPHPATKVFIAHA